MLLSSQVIGLLIYLYVSFSSTLYSTSWLVSVLMTSELIALRNLITSSIDNIVSICHSSGKEFPSLDKAINETEFTPDGIRNHPLVVENVALLVSAASQLIATVRSPPQTLTVSAYGVC